MPSKRSRKETIHIGKESIELVIPKGTLWGAETQLALDNFTGSNGESITGYKVPKEFIYALVTIKRAAAKVNGELGAIPHEVAKAIIRACDEVLKGKWDDQFPLDVVNAGACTSVHMNVNEVLANRATEILQRGNKKAKVDQHNHVNYGQSTNDVIPTTIRISAVLAARPLVVGVEALEEGGFEVSDRSVLAPMEVPTFFRLEEFGSYCECRFVPPETAK